MMHYDEYHDAYNLSRTCRACLCLQDQPQIINAEMYEFCTSVPVTPNDGLPMSICVNCAELINRLYYFKLQCLKSNAVLKERSKTMVQNVKDAKTESDLSNRDPKRYNSETDMPVASNDDNYSNTKECDVDRLSQIVQSNEIEVRPASEDEQKNEKKSSKKYKKSSKRTSTMLYCQKCDKSFYKYIKLEAHMRKHFGMKPDYTIQCSQCDKKFTNEKNLKSHLRVHSGERKYKCNTCGKCFAYLNVLKNHERAHAGIKKYVCHECGKKFVQLSNLNTHMLLHTGEKPYTCEPCNRRFGQPSEYKLHMLRHTGVKNFACTLCPLRFYTNANLQKHMGVHSDARPYACKLCEKRFKTRSYMAIHNRTHTGERPFSCDYCPMKFMSGKDKRNHHKTHTGERAPTRLRKTKADNALSNTDLHPVVNHQQLVCDQNINEDHVISSSNANPYIPQQDEQNADKLIPKNNCSYHTTKSVEYHVPPGSKPQCSFINPMY